MTDYREQWEKDLEAEARSPLNERDEQRAHQIIEAMRTPYKGVAYKIGEALYAEGGHRAMVRMHYRVKYLSGEGRPLESLWDGIGDWQR